MNIERIIINPIMTEKSNAIRSKHGQFSFKVHPQAGKMRIREALEKLFNVEVDKIRVISSPQKPRRDRRLRMGYKSGFKKAIVSLKPGKTFDFYEGV